MTRRKIMTCLSYRGIPAAHNHVRSSTNKEGPLRPCLSSLFELYTSLLLLLIQKWSHRTLLISRDGTLQTVQQHSVSMMPSVQKISHSFVPDVLKRLSYISRHASLNLPSLVLPIASLYPYTLELSLIPTGSLPNKTLDWIHLESEVILRAQWFVFSTKLFSAN